MKRANKRYIFFIFVLLCTLVACKKDERFNVEAMATSETNAEIENFQATFIQYVVNNPEVSQRGNVLPSLYRGVTIREGYATEFWGCNQSISFPDETEKEKHFLGKLKLDFGFSSENKVTLKSENSLVAGKHAFEVVDKFVLIASPDGKYNTLYRRGFGNYARLPPSGIVNRRDAYYIDHHDANDVIGYCRLLEIKKSLVKKSLE